MGLHADKDEFGPGNIIIKMPKSTNVKMIELDWLTNQVTGASFNYQLLSSSPIPLVKRIGWLEDYLRRRTWRVSTK